MIVKPWWVRFTQRTARRPIVHVTLIGPVCHLRPSPSATGCVPTKESWLSRARVGRPADARKTKPGSPTLMALGAGTGWALQSTWLAGASGGWIAMPHVTLSPSAVHSAAPDVEPCAGADVGADTAMPSTQTGIRSRERRTA